MKVELGLDPFFELVRYAFLVQSKAAGYILFEVLLETCRGVAPRLARRAIPRAPRASAPAPSRLRRRRPRRIACAARFNRCGHLDT
jgi:hypothetical protein